MTHQHSAYQQASRYLHLLETMSIEAQRSFRKIYALAPHIRRQASGVGYLSGLSGRHVRMAMMESLAHPKIAYWVRMNLALRVARKLAQVTGQQERVERLDHLLESFHVAADAFMFKLPVDLAMAQRTMRHAQESSLHPISAEAVALQPNFPSGLPPADLDRIQQFKRKIIPGFIQAIREKHGSSDGDFAGA